MNKTAPLPPPPSPPRSPKPSEIEMASGAFVDLVKPRAATICIEDIAQGLSYTFRYNGQTRLSVAEHSINVAMYLVAILEITDPHVILAALLHDGSEAYIGDQTRPFKKAMGTISAEAVRELRAMHERLQDAILEKYGVGSLSWVHRKAIKAADVAVFEMEGSKVLPSKGIGWDKLMSLKERSELVVRFQDKVKGAFPSSMWSSSFPAYLSSEDAYASFIRMFGGCLDNVKTHMLRINAIGNIKQDEKARSDSN